MKPSSITKVLLCSFLCLLTSAWPLLPVIHLPRRLEQRAPQPYSVVAVDGGSSANGMPTTRTVTEPITKTETHITTIISTIVVSDSTATSTTVLSVTSTTATTITETPSPSGDMYPGSPVTLTVTATPSITKVPYDDGTWHTTYFRISTVEATITPPVPTAPPPPPAPEQWSSWSDKNVFAKYRPPMWERPQ